MHRQPPPTTRERKPVARLAVRGLLAFVLAATLVAASLVAFEFTLKLDGQRDRIARAVSAALDVPVVIDGPVKLYTGPRAGLELGRVRVGSAEAGRGWTLDATRLVARVQTFALLRKEVRIVDGVAEGALFCVHGGIDGSPPPRRTPPERAWTLTDIARLQARQLSIVAGPACDPGRPLMEVQSLELRAPRGAVTSISARTLVAGQQAEVAAQGPSLSALAGRLADQPFELTAGFAGAAARVAGRIDLARVEFDAEMSFVASQFVDVVRPLGAPLRDFGPLSVRGRVAGSRDRLDARLDEVSLAPVTATAQVTLDWSGPRPTLAFSAGTGQLDVDALRDWLGRILDEDRSRAGGMRELATAALRASDGRFALDIRQLKTGSVSLSGVSWEGAWRDGEIRTTARGALARDPILASLDADVRPAEPAVSAKASARRLVLPPALGVAGTLGSVQLDYVAKSATRPGAAPPSRAVVTAGTANLRLPLAKGGTTPLKLARTRIDWHVGESLSGIADAAVFGEVVKVKVEGSDIGALWRGGTWAVRADAQLEALRLAARGDLALRDGHVDADLLVELLGRRRVVVAAGSGAPPGLPFSAQGAVALKAGNWRVDVASASWGDTRASGWSAGGWPVGSRPVRIDAQFDVLDVAQLAAGAAEVPPAGFELPRDFALPAADVALRASRVVLPGGVATNARVDAVVRDGRIVRAPFAFEHGGGAVRGTLAADLSGPAAVVEVSAEGSGVRASLPAGDQDAPRPELRAGEFSVAASSGGNRPRELAANARVQVALRQASLNIPARAAAPAISVDLVAATLSASPGQPTRLEFDAVLDGAPAHVGVRLPALADWKNADNGGFEADGRMDGIEASVSGPLPGAGPSGRPLRVGVAAPSLASFNGLLGDDLPRTGRLRLDADVRAVADEGPSGSVRLSIGESRVDAQFERRLAGDRPRWHLDLVSPRVRLEDLGAANWLDDDTRHGDAAPGAPSAPARASGKARALVQRIREEARLAGRRFDASARVEVDSVTSGAEDFGKLDAVATIDSGRLAIAPLSLAGPSGRLRLAASSDLAAGAAPFALDVDLSQFAYGRLLRSIDPGRAGDGELSFRMNVKGSGDGEAALRSLDGKVGVLAVPSTYGGVRRLERWGSGLLTRIGSTLDPEQSRLNCGVAVFDVTQGVARSKALMLDTTRVRAAGELEVDLPSGKLKGVFASKSKRPDLFSARVPLVVEGTLQAPRIEPAAGSVLLTAARYFYFAYAFLFDTVDGAAYPADGTPDCFAAYRKLQE